VKETLNVDLSLQRVVGVNKGSCYILDVNDVGCKIDGCKVGGDSINIKTVL
jgi:hypothetical protein